MKKASNEKRMRSYQDIFLSIIRAQGATLKAIERALAAEEDAMKRKARNGYVNLILVGSFFSRIRVTLEKCRGTVTVFADEFKQKARSK